MTSASLATPGALVRARGREWLVLPGSTAELLVVRPVGGLDEETTGILTGIEPVLSASFPLPSLSDLGDFHAGALLRDAARLSTRAAAGPFRSFGRIAVEPRPYQLVPLMMALQLDPIRLLIADDVGIGKTIEASLVGRELLDRGEISRLSVLCPPHLAEQWQEELLEKFHIEAELVLSGTIQRLERDLPHGVSVFDRHKYTVVSTDFIKSRNRRDDFALKCPEFVIIDEAHGCTPAMGRGAGRQLRYELVKQLATSKDRHMVFVTATPHSGNEDAFRALLGLLNPDLGSLPAQLESAATEGIRRKLARHLIQRRRADIKSYLDTDTSFPTRLDAEHTYSFSPEYKSLFNDVIAFAREFVTSSKPEGRIKRVRYWSALALLRCLSSSPAAAIATLRSRANVDDSKDEADANEIGRRTVLDQDDTDDATLFDLSPGSEVSEKEADSARRKLLAFAKRAAELDPKHDHKLQEAMKQVKQLVSEGFNPIVFCRYVDTAEYVAKHLRTVLPKGIGIDAVTGMLPPHEREERIATLGEADRRVLVCTDCLSEGINLQRDFDAILHYDLCWNPTRHEQREGRVDRFGQEKTEVRVLTFYGRDNPIDGVILNVLIRKHKNIKSDLGVSVSVPGSSEQVAEAIFEGALFKGMSGTDPNQLYLDFEEAVDSQKSSLHKEWDAARDREKASRSRYAQHALKPEVVAQEMAAVRTALGSKADVERFFRTTLNLLSVPLRATPSGALDVSVSAETPRALRQALQRETAFRGRFDLPLQHKEVYLGRTSPTVEGLAGWLLDQALDSTGRERNPVAARCGIIKTKAVPIRTILILARFRSHLKPRVSEETTLLCEEIAPLAFIGSADSPKWLSQDDSDLLLAATPDANVTQSLRDQQLPLLFASLPILQKPLERIANERAQVQLAAHERVRESVRAKAKVSVSPVLPVDILGAFVLLPT